MLRFVEKDKHGKVGNSSYLIHHWRQCLIFLVIGIWIDYERTILLKFLSVIGSNFRSDGSRCTCHHVQKNKSQDRTQIKTKNWRNQSSEKVQVRISDLEYRLQNPDTLGLRKPRQKDTASDHNVVNAQKIREATNKHLFSNSIAWDSHRGTFGGGVDSAPDGSSHILCFAEIFKGFLAVKVGHST